MKLGKHLAGLALFLLTFGGTVIITKFLTTPIAAIAPVRIEAATPHGYLADAAPQFINYKARLVSLDFIKGKSYTTLVLKREAGQSAPEKLWVKTIFFSPDHYASKQWSSLAEIRRPFSHGERVEITATGECGWCEERDAPEAGYYAQVYVSTEYPDDSQPREMRRNIISMVPVVVQTRRQSYR